MPCSLIGAQRQQSHSGSVMCDYSHTHLDKTHLSALLHAPKAITPTRHGDADVLSALLGRNLQGSRAGE